MFTFLIEYAHGIEDLMYSHIIGIDAHVASVGEREWVLHYVFTMVFLWHHVKEEVQIELVKKAEMISRRIGHVPSVATVLQKKCGAEKCQALIREGLGL